MTWLYLSTPHWTVTIEVDHMLVVVSSPPIARWMVGKRIDKVIEKVYDEHSEVILRELL